MPAVLSRLKTTPLTAWILYLAAYAHLVLGLVSGVHQADMLRDGVATGVIVCSPFGKRQVQLLIPGEDVPQTQTGVNCPVCTLASMPVTASPCGQPNPIRQESLVDQIPVDQRSDIPTVTLVLLPPTRAPPATS